MATGTTKTEIRASQIMATKAQTEIIRIGVQIGVWLKELQFNIKKVGSRTEM
jgi:hypothetical protein